VAVSFQGNRCRRRATPNGGEEEEGEGRTGLTSQHTIYLILNHVFGYSALEQGSVYKTWESDCCLTSWGGGGGGSTEKENPTPQTGSLDTFCLDSWQTAGCRSQTQYNYLLACYFIWLPKSGLFYTEPWKNSLHLLKEYNAPLEVLHNRSKNSKTFSQDLL